MAALRRDNGILALKYDLFETAKNDLQRANSLQSGDVLTNFYLGRVHRLTAGSEQDREVAERHFRQAIEFDEQRGVLPDAHLELALLKIQTRDPESYSAIQASLKTYVALYQRNNAGALPANMDAIYDYMSITGDNTWSVARVLNVAHTNVAGGSSNPQRSGE